MPTDVGPQNFACADSPPSTVRVVPTLDHVVWAVPSIARVSARVLESTDW